MVSDKNLKRFIRATKALNKVIADCKSDLPGAFAYLDGNGNFCLLDGSVSIGDVGDQDTIIAISQLNAAGGDW